ACVAMFAATSYNVPESPSSYTPAQMPSMGNTPYSSRLASQSGTVIYSSEHGGKGSMSGTKGGAQTTKDAQKAAPTQTSTGNVNAQGAGVKKGFTGSSGFTVKALYDYTAADKDEVTFIEGDIIVNCQKVDEGWMTGTVQRTLQWGMLPANYVERVKQPTGLHYLNKKK
uniref:SH3 domain-containing protein n=1 Tax=Parascaris univalens TaxID=6257 RepID=A0A915CHN9_PARUN